MLRPSARESKFIARAAALLRALAIGISAVAVAIRSPEGELAAMSIPVTTKRFNGTEEELARALVKHTRGCSRSYAP